MDAIIKQVEFPGLGLVNLGDSISFQEKTGVFTKVEPGQPKGDEVIAYYTGTIKSFEIGTNVMQGTHGIIIICENIEFVKASNPMYKCVVPMIKWVNDYKNVIEDN